MDEESVQTANPPQSETSTQQGELERHSSFLGVPAGVEASAEEPETSAEEEITETDVTPEDESTTEQEPEEEEADWLPDEQQKVFPDDVLARYAKRYGRTLEQLQADPQLKQLIQDKINSDILIQQSRESSEVEEPTPQETEEQEPAAAPPADPGEARKQYEQQIQQLIESTVDQKSVEQLGRDLLAGFGVDITSKDPEVQALLQNAPKVGSTLVKGAVDLMATIMPHLAQNVLERSFPGFGQMYERSVYALAWDQVRNQKDGTGKQPYSSLPAYGTEQFSKVLREAAAQIPGFDEMVFTKSVRNAQGRVVQVPLAPHEQAQRKYAMLAKMASGQQVNPAVVQQAVETGKRIAQETQRSRQQGKALGAGQSKNQIQPPEDDINSQMIAAYNNRHGNIFK